MARKKRTTGKRVKCDVCQAGHLSPTGKLTEAIRFRCLMGGNRVKGQLERAWASAVFVRDDYTCQRCTKGRMATTLHPHHVIRRGHSKKLKYDVDNGLTLCEGCHLWWHQNDVDAGIWFVERWQARWDVLCQRRTEYSQESSSVPRDYWWTLYEQLRAQAGMNGTLDRQGVEWEKV